MNIILGHMAFRKINTEHLVTILVYAAGNRWEPALGVKLELHVFKSERKTKGHLFNSLIQD